MSAPGPVPIETLLRHRGWVRGLARSLVLDESRADDLEQQAWLDALRSPPLEDRGLRGWFASVLRRRARDAWRSGERRAAREEAAARPEAARSTADVVADAETHRRVVDAVMALEEPYREAVLLRFFEDLPPREVAARTGVPVETARTRTRRALERLRERLDARHGGDRAAWVAMVAPLAGLRWEPGAAMAAGGTGATASAAIAGGGVMAAKATVAAAVAGAAAGAILGGVSAATVAGGGVPARELEAARAEVRELRGRLEAVETASARPAGGAAVEERVASQERRLRAVEETVAATRAATAPSGGEAAVESAAVAERRAVAKVVVAGEVREVKRQGDADLQAAAAALQAEAEASAQETRRKFLDRSLPEADRASLLEKLRGLRAIDQEVAVAVVELFRASTSAAVRERLLRDVHGTKLPELKGMFLEALRGDPDETVRDRACRDIDDYLDDPEVVKALEAAKDGDASKLVRDRAARRLRDRGRDAPRKDD